MSRDALYLEYKRDAIRKIEQSTENIDADGFSKERTGNKPALEKCGYHCTIADLAGNEVIEPSHMLESLQYRAREM